jgi:hypothetical protein
MKAIKTLSLILLAIFAVSCGIDRPSDPPASEPETGNNVDQKTNYSDHLDVGVLIKEGLRLDAPFIMGPNSPTTSVVYMEGENTLDTTLRTDGFYGPLESLALVEGINGAMGNVLLHISEEGIFGSDGQRLLDQIPALHGYAWRIGTSAEQATLAGRSYISVIILDENGYGVSDELYIYWKSAPDSVGGFVVTNIPNEIL